MKLYVLSDTHGNIDKALEVYQKLHSLDFVIHLGDTLTDAEKISRAIGRPVISVRGNNDFSPRTEDFRILETEYGNLLLAHGHTFGVKSGLQNLLYKALELDCKAALFGHTHKPVFTECEGVYLLNPGSLTIPMDGTSGSYAIVNTTKNEFTASICFP